MVIAKTANTRGINLPEGEDEYKAVAQRIEALVRNGQLEVQGDIKKWRYSEVRRRCIRKWRVRVSGTNFQWIIKEKSARSRLQRMGFVTMVFVTAPTSTEAELGAVQVLREDRSLRRGLRNAKDDPPSLIVDEIEEISSFRGCRRPRMGLVLYAERRGKGKQ